MPAAVSDDEPGERPYALLEALLAGDADAALSLLGRSPLVYQEFNFTALHAAVLGECAASIPVLVAAGVPVDAAVHISPDMGWEALGPLRELLALSVWRPRRLMDGTTALNLARYAPRC